VTGPFEDDAEVRDLPAIRAVYKAFRADPGMGKMAPHKHRLLCEALSAAGVELAAHDHAIVLWLAEQPPATVAVVCGLIGRAHEARKAALPGTAGAAIDVAADGEIAVVIGGRAGGGAGPAGGRRVMIAHGCHPDVTAGPVWAFRHGTHAPGNTRSGCAARDLNPEPAD
jgi:hypothetical protein